MTSVGGRGVVAAERDDRVAGDLGLALVLAGSAPDLDDVTEVHVVVVEVEDEDAVRRRRVAVAGVLDVEAAQGRGRAFVVTHDDAADGGESAGHRRARAAALDATDRVDRTGRAGVRRHGDRGGAAVIRADLVGDPDPEARGLLESPV